MLGCAKNHVYSDFRKASIRRAYGNGNKKAAMPIDIVASVLWVGSV
jgi:hypothetical protein